MKGTRPLTTDEIIVVAQQFTGTFAVRNRSLFMLGVSVGGRISELLALTIGDVWQNGKPVSDLLFRKGVVKGKGASRMVPVNRDGQLAIGELVRWHHEKYGDLDPDRPLFPSRKGQGSGAMTRKTGHEVLKDAFVSAGLNGKLATHSLRKSFAQRVFDAFGNIYLVQELLGHTTVETTRQYLGISYRLMQSAVESIELAKGNTFEVLLHSETPVDKNNTDVESLLQELERKNRIIDQLLSMTEANDEEMKVVPISVARRKKLGRPTRLT